MKTLDWKRAIGEPLLKVNNNIYICSNHFKAEDYLSNYIQRRRLHPDAVPSLNIPQIHFERKLYFSIASTSSDSQLNLPSTSSGQENAISPSPLISNFSSSSVASDYDIDKRKSIEVETFTVPRTSLLLTSKRKRNQEQTCKVISSSSDSSSEQSLKQQKRVLFVKSILSYSKSPSKVESDIEFKRRDILKLKNKLNASRQKIKRLKRNVTSLHSIVKV